MAALAAFALVCALPLGACKGCEDGGSGADAAETATIIAAPVPAPEGHLADLYVATPNATWARIQRGVGGAVGILPASAGGIVCALAGFDPGVAAEIDGAAPVHGVVSGDPVRPSWALAMKVIEPRKARAVLLDADTARFTAREVPLGPGSRASDLTELAPKVAAEPGAPALALTRSGYLVIASRAEELPRLGPYLVRTLPARAAPGQAAIVVDVPRSALAGVLGPRLGELWTSARGYLLAADERSRHEHGGKAPDFGDPATIVAALDGWVTRRTAVLADLQRVRLSIDVPEEGISLLATLTPQVEGPAARWVAAMQTGDGALVAGLPATSALAISLRDRDDDAKAQGTDLEKAMLAALGPRLPEADAKRVSSALADWTSARGEVVAASLQWDEPRGVAVVAPLRDEAAATRSVRSVLELSRASPFKDMLRVRDVTFTTEEASGLGTLQLATITRDAPSSPPSPSARGDAGALAGARPGKARVAPYGVAWVAGGSRLTVAVSEAAPALLRASARPERKLGDEPAIAASLRAIGGGASTLVVAQPLRFDPSRANLPAAPLVLALGRGRAAPGVESKDAFLRADVAFALLRDLARRQMGL